MTPEQFRIAVQNTAQKPRNAAPAIYAALKNKPAEAGLLCPWAGHHNEGGLLWMPTRIAE